jgi:hypothetical protein
LIPKIGINAQDVTPAPFVRLALGWRLAMKLTKFIIFGVNFRPPRGRGDDKAISTRRRRDDPLAVK